MTLRAVLVLAALASCAPDATPATQTASGAAASAAAPEPPSAPSKLTKSDETSPSRPDNPVVAVDGEGLRLFDRATGSARLLAFGQARAAVLAPLERQRGPAGTGTKADCGAGPVEYANWADGLSLVFQNGRFAGWSLDGRAAGAITTAAGVGPGSTRAALENAYDARIAPSTLGTEFTAGAMAGVLDGAGADAKITDMWAGVSCVAR